MAKKFSSEILAPLSHNCIKVHGTALNFFKQLLLRLLQLFQCASFSYSSAARLQRPLRLRLRRPCAVETCERYFWDLGSNIIIIIIIRIQDPSKPWGCLVTTTTSTSASQFSFYAVNPMRRKDGYKGCDDDVHSLGQVGQALGAKLTRILAGQPGWQS